jgi:hypothetical protein
MLPAGALDLVTEHPEAACYFDLDAREMTLNSGAKVPVVGVFDTDGEPLENADLDLCSEIIITFGPTPCSGYMLQVCARLRNPLAMAA